MFFRISVGRARHEAERGGRWRRHSAPSTPPNITPDLETGIGDWTAEDFLHVLHEGISPDGSPHYPAFPYGSYAGMSEADREAIADYLMDIPPLPENHSNTLP